MKPEAAVGTIMPSRLPVGKREGLSEGLLGVE